MFWKSKKVESPKTVLRSWQRTTSPREAVNVLAVDVMNPEGLSEAKEARRLFVAFIDAYDLLIRARYEQEVERDKLFIKSMQGTKHEIPDIKCPQDIPL